MNRHGFIDDNRLLILLAKSGYRFTTRSGLRPGFPPDRFPYNAKPPSCDCTCLKNSTL